MQFDQYKKMFEQMLVSTTFDMIRLQSKLFLPIGLELNSMNIFLEFPIFYSNADRFPQ
jgi:hypothetical protein